MERKWDLALHTSTRGMTVHTWSRGFFEDRAKLAIDPKPEEYIEVGQYRIRKSEYEERPELFDKFLARQGVDKYGPQKRYEAANIKRVPLNLNRKTDADIIEYLENKNAQGTIKAALREMMKK